MSNMVLMPKLGLTMESGIIVNWLKAEGDRVEKGENIVEIESDKSTIEVESQLSGIILKIYYKKGDEIPCGKVIAVIGEKDDKVSDSPPDADMEALNAQKEKEKSVESVSDSKKKMTGIKKDRIIASPRAKRYAKAKDLDLSLIKKGSGTGGRIEEDDVIRFFEVNRDLSLETKIGDEGSIEIPISKMRLIIAEKVTRSKFTSPHYYLNISVNMEEFLKIRDVISNHDPENKVSINSILIKIITIALSKHPYMNASWRGDKIIIHRNIDIGVAVETEDGLLTPVVKSCQKKNISEIDYELKDLLDRARQCKLMPEQYHNSSFTISNLGMYDIESFTAIINPPAAAILAIGKIIEKPVGINHEITLKPIMQVTLSCDHRLIDGAKGAAFLKSFKNIIEKPFEGNGILGYDS